MPHGSLSIEKNFTPWTKSDTDAYLTSLAVGLFAGIAVTYLRTPLHLPGHKALFWIAPALAFRLLTCARAGATTAALATLLTTFLLGGNLGGGWAMMPLVILAGVALDLAVRFAEQCKLSVWSAILFLASAGLLANLICFIKRIFDPAGPLSASANLQDLLTASLSYALFGLLAGALGASCALPLLKHRRHPQPQNSFQN